MTTLIDRPYMQLFSDLKRRTDERFKQEIERIEAQDRKPTRKERERIEALRFAMNEED